MKPELDKEALSKHAALNREDPLAAFNEAVRNRTLDLVKEGFPSSVVALEVLESALSALEKGLPHGAIRTAYSDKAWQDSTVEIPTALLEILIAGWRKYKTTDPGVTFGECLAIEGGGQGKLPQKSKLAQFNLERSMSNKAVVERLAEGMSWEKAAEVVSDEDGEKRSADSVRRYSQKRRRKTLDELRRKGIID